MPLTLLDFVRKWNASLLTERSSSQQHFRDLCEALGVPHPTELDEIGTAYTFDKRVTKLSGGEGFADVWKRGFFAWEYKSKGGDLKAAYRQLSNYHEALENPPLLVVCDFVRFEVHTKFENAPTRVYAFTLDDLLLTRDTPTSALPPVEVFRACFTDFNPLRPERTAVRVTRAAASDLLRLATRLELEPRPTPLSREQIAHFLMRIVFCLFADSIGLLPEHTFRDLVLSKDRFLPTRFRRKLRTLFQAMSEEDGIFGPHTIRYFNGGLFDSDAVIDLDVQDLAILASAANHDWAHIEPTIFGTLFERSLDAAKRSLIGAHYTSTDDILLLIEPVVMQPLYRRWDAVRAEAEAALAAEGNEPGTPSTEPGAPSSLQSHRSRVGSAPAIDPGPESASLNQPRVPAPAKTRGLKTRPIQPAPTTQPAFKLDRPALKILTVWVAELSRVTVLDPACGSGNFLYVALRRLLDLWYEAQRFATAHGLALLLDPMPNPQQLFGIETDFYAHEIASVVVWIGFLQWKHEHAIQSDKEPLLEKLDNIKLDNAILRYDAHGNAYEPTWQPTDFIVGNPPFLGGKKLKRHMGIEEVNSLFEVYKDRVAAESDLVVYWFEKSRAILHARPNVRAGLLATQQIRKGFNQRVLKKITEGGSIFWARSNQPWVVITDKKSKEGKRSHHVAQVRIAMVGFDNGTQQSRTLDGILVPRINPDLTSGINVTTAIALTENKGLCHQGPTRVGRFDLTEAQALKMLVAPLNPNGRPNEDVVRPYVRTTDLTDRPRRAFIIDFGGDMSEVEAALYQLPFEQIRSLVKPYREKALSGDKTGVSWWRHQRPRPALRKALTKLTRCIVTPRTSKHRFFVWMPNTVVPDTRVYTFIREDDYFFGVLHSRAQETWTLANCAWHGVGNDPSYIKETCFDTFPFPWPPNNEPTAGPDQAKAEAIAAAARHLVTLRDHWLNPPNTPEADLKKRTLTNLYNTRPTWLADAHRALDEAVFAAYGWPADLATPDILARLLALNHERAANPKNSPSPVRITTME